MPAERVPGSRRRVGIRIRRRCRRCGLVRQLRAEVGSEYGTVQLVAKELGYGIESVRSWVRQADIDEGVTAGTTTADVERIKRLEQENRDLRCANEIRKRASAFFAAELDRPQK